MGAPLYWGPEANGNCLTEPIKAFAFALLASGTYRSISIGHNSVLYMKRILFLSTFLSATAFVGAQSFEWNTSAPPAAAAAHPKEVQATEVRTYGGQAETPATAQVGTAGVYAPSAQGTATAYGETYRAEELTGSHPQLPLGTLLRVTNTENGRTVVVRVTDSGKECTDCLITLSEAAAKQLGIQGTAAVSVEEDGFSNWNPVPPAVEPTAPATTYRSVASTSVSSEPTAAPQTAPAPVTFNRYSVARPADAPLASAEPTTPSVVAPPAPTVPGRQEARGAESTTAAVNPVPAATTGQYAVQLAAYSNEAYASRRVEELQQQGVADVYYRTITKPSGEVINRVYAGRFVNVTEAQTAARTIQHQHNIAGIVAKM